MELTKLEQFVWDNRDRSCDVLATELNRSLGAIQGAFNRAHEKMRNFTDVLVRSEGSIFLLTPMTDAAREWISNHIPEDAQYMGRSLVVEHRYVADIVAGMQSDGLIVK